MTEFVKNMLAISRYWIWETDDTGVQRMVDLEKDESIAWNFTGDAPTTYEDSYKSEYNPEVSNESGRWRPARLSEMKKFKSYKPPHEIVELNKEYHAKVYKDKIEVGCQTFPIEILEKLQGAYDSLKTRIH